MLVWQEGFLAEGAWLPQLGDDVVYIAEGHRRLLEKLGSDAARPWETITADEVRAHFLLSDFAWRHISSCILVEHLSLSPKKVAAHADELSWHLEFAPKYVY